MFLIAKHVYLGGVPVAAVGIAGLIGVAMYASAAGMYMRTILYRFATGKPIPDLGVNVADAFGTLVAPPLSARLATANRSQR